MTNVEDFGKFETAWCPGCGNFSILAALKEALAACDLEPHRLLLTSGIGQAAKTPHYLRCNAFNGLHGRSLPPAIGAKLANHELTVIAESGDGCTYGEGGNHFLAAIRRNLDITILVHDNQIYGLTKGQASPTSIGEMVTKAQPHGVLSAPFNPLAVALVLGAGFVARGFAGDKEQLTDVIARAIRYRGTALIDILQPCVSFNHLNTFAWYKERCYQPEGDGSSRTFAEAMELTMEFGDRIPTGILYQKEKRIFEERQPALAKGPLVKQQFDAKAFGKILDGFAV
ncbi:MAG: thiamine pyrophosphate-dependent enzyme [Deltaproteobacteria bacterium]